MLSETYAVNKGIVPALDKLNMVRQRSGLSIINSSSVSNIFVLRKLIEDERRLEFAFENQRWFDLVRTGRAVEVVNQHFATESLYNTPGNANNPKPIKEWQLFLPIPQYEINLNPNLSQNIGY
jgi:starch-binding outer membrane protein, SusD/RagB family